MALAVAVVAVLTLVLVGVVALGAVLLPAHRPVPVVEAALPRSDPAAAWPSTGPIIGSSTAAEPADPGTPLPRSAPVRLQVPAVGIDTDLVELGLIAEGSLEVPTAGFPAGWFTGAPTPGQTGPAVLVGHVDHGGAPAVFFRLHELRLRDEISVTRADGAVVVFAVQRVDQVPKDAFPTDEVYGDIDHSGLRLITCGGSIDRSTGHYRDNVVAYADLVRVVPAPRQGSAGASRG